MAQNRSLRRLHLRMNDAQGKVFLEWIKIVVAMEQGKAGFQAKGCNHTVDGLAHRMA